MAITSQGTTLKVKTGGEAGTFINIAGFKDFSDLGGGSSSVIDVSDLSSTAKEKLAGLRDEGQIKCDFNLIPADSGQLALETARAGSALTDFELTLSDGTQYAFSGFVLSLPKSGGVDAPVTLSATIEISGAVTKTAAQGA